MAMSRRKRRKRRTPLPLLLPLLVLLILLHLGRMAGIRFSDSSDPSNSTVFPCAVNRTVTLKAWTCTAEDSDPASSVYASVFFAGAWTDQELLLASADQGSLTSRQFTLRCSPAKVRLRMHGSSGWGLYKMRLTIKGSDHAIGTDLDSAAGDCSTQPAHWLGGNSDAPACRQAATNVGDTPDQSQRGNSKTMCTNQVDKRCMQGLLETEPSRAKHVFDVA